MPLASNSGGGGQPNDVRAGGAYVEVSARDKLSAQLAGMGAKARAFAAGLAHIGRATAFTGLAALTPLAALFKGGLNRAEEIDKLADELGFSVEQMQRLKYAADVAGVSVEEVLRKPEKYGKLMAGATILDAGTIKEAVEAQQKMRAALIDLETAALPLLATFTPIVKAVSQFVKDNKDLVPALALGAAAFVMGKALGLVVTLAKPAIVLVGALLTQTGLIVGAVGGVAALILMFTDSGRKLAGDLGTTFTNVGQTFGVMIKGITDAIEAGDFDRAFRIFTAGVEAVWYEMLLNMARAFSEFIEKNRDRLVALGSLIGGIEGVKIGGRFGPWGALFGGVGGAIGGGVAADQLAKFIEGIASNTGLEQRRDEAQKRLKALGGPAARIDNEDLTRRVSAVRSAFRVLSDANQQFGGTTIDSQILEQMKKAVQQGQVQGEVLKQIRDTIAKSLNMR